MAKRRRGKFPLGIDQPNVKGPICPVARSRVHVTYVFVYTNLIINSRN